MPGKGIDSARILLVEDERAVREMARLILEHEGWAVVEAGSLEQAGGCIRAENGYFDLFILDLHLPDGLGTHLAEEIRRCSQNARVLFATGDQGWLRRLESEGAAVLPKPFTPLQIIEAVRHILAERRPVAVVIEPGPVERRLIQCVLERRGLTVRVTAHFDEGLRLAEECDSAVLLTIPPEGESAQGRLRELRKTNPRLRVIALGAEASAGQDWCDGAHGPLLGEAGLVHEIERVLESRLGGTRGRSEGAGVHQHGDG